MRRIVAISLVLGLTLACGKKKDGDGPSTSGALDQVYRVTSYQVADGSCGQGEAIDWGEPYFRLVESDGAIAYHVCRTADDCDNSPSYTLYETDEGWADHDAGSSCCDEGGCGIFSTSWQVVADASEATFELFDCYVDKGVWSDPSTCADEAASAPTCGRSSVGCIGRTTVKGEPAE